MFDWLRKKYSNRQYLRDVAVGRQRWGRVSNFAAEDEGGAIIQSAILEERPLLVGKLGTNEQHLLMWHTGTTRPTPLVGEMPMFYWQTRSCATGAGARPRSKESYHELAEVFLGLLPEIDLLSVFFFGGEYALWRRYAPQARPTWHGVIEPFHCAEPWSSALTGKKVMVISPFADTIRGQLDPSVRLRLWPGKNVLPDFELVTYRFPYLIDPATPLSWQGVFADAREAIVSHAPDVVLTGCGALSMPLAHVAKGLGKVGIHLGGTLQLMFGIIGSRYEQNHLRDFINEAWVRPLPQETPREPVKKAVEDGCYW